MQREKLIFLDRTNPRYPPPEESVSSINKLLSNEVLSSYSSARGIEALRSAIVQKIKITNNAEIDQDQVIVTAGSSNGILLSLLLCQKNPGIILCPSPSYPAYPRLLHALCRRVEFYHINTALGFSQSIVEIKKIARKKRISTLILNTPHNPTGEVIPQSTLHELIQLTEKCGIQIISDEAYENYNYRSTHVSPISFGLKNNCYVVYSFSKTYSLSGIRLGYVVVPYTAKPRAEQLHRAMIINTPVFSQIAALAALLNKKFPKAAHMFYKTQMLEGIKVLKTHSLPVFPPKGGLSYWINIAKSRVSAELFTSLCLHKGKIVIQPGTVFGHQYNDFIRVSFAGDQKQTMEGMERLGFIWQQIQK